MFFVADLNLKHSWIGKLTPINQFTLWSFVVLLAVLLAESIVAGMALWLKGQVTADYLLTGFVAAFSVAIIMTLLLYLLLMRLVQLQQDNQQLIAAAAEHEQLLNALRLSEQRLSFSLDSLAAGVWEINLPSRKMHYSAQCAAMLGYASQELSAEHLEDWIARFEGSHAPLFANKLQLFIAHGNTTERLTLELRMVLNNGTYSWFKLCALLVKSLSTDGDLKVIGTLINIHERKTAEAQLYASSLYARSLIEASLDPLVTIDDQGKITDVNQATEQITGLPRTLLIGKEFSSYFTAPKAAQRAYQIAFEQGTISNYPLTIQHVSGKQTAVLYNANVYCNPVGEVQGVLASARDVTAQLKAQAELQALNETLEAKIKERTQALEHEKRKAEAATEAKSHFLSSMSHEIRTPINSILGMAYLALNSLPITASKQRDYLQKIHYSGEHLLALINDILDFSKIEAGKLAIHLEPFLVGTLTENLLSMFAEAMQQKGLQFSVETDDAIPKALLGDALRIQQVLINFINNAYKFTEQGYVRVHIQLLSESAHDCLLKFIVQDNGIGLSPEEQHRLFQSFQQADDSVSRKFGGTGLGLAICKQMTELMGGHIGVESQKGVGSAFWFTLRFDQCPLDAVKIINPQANNADLGVLQGAKILLVEDNTFNQQVSLELLQKRGALVTIANNGVEALACLASQVFDCILMDMQMPEMDGLETTRRIRQQHHLNQVAVIAMTANALTSERDKCLNAGMNDFISKPVKPQLLYATLVKWLDGRFNQAMPVTSNNSVSSSKACSASPALLNNPDIIDLTEFSAMVDHNIAELRRFAAIFLSAIQQGLQELDNALQQQNYTAIHATAHRIKSSAKTIGAFKFAALCQALENTHPDSLPSAVELISQLQQLLVQIQQQLNLHLTSSPSEQA